MQFWFLYVYFLLLAAYAGLARVGVPRFGLSLFFATLWLCPAGGIGLYWRPMTLLQLNAIYFVVGDLVQSALISRFNKQLQNPLSVLGVTVAGFVLVYVLTANETDWPHAVHLAAAFLGIAGTCLLSYWLASFDTLALVRICGVYSLEIYVLHTIVSAGVRIALVHVWGITDLAPHFVLGVTAGVSIPALAGHHSRRHHYYWLFRFPDHLSRKTSGDVTRDRRSSLRKE